MNVGDFKGKLRENVTASADRLALNKDLARIVTDLDLPIEPEDCVMGDWDAEEVRRLFASLEFRSLFDRLQDIARGAKPKADVADLDLREISEAELARIVAGGAPLGVRLLSEGGRVLGAAVSVGGAQAAFARLDTGLGQLGGFLADPEASK